MRKKQEIGRRDPCGLVRGLPARTSRQRFALMERGRPARHHRDRVAY